MHISTEMYPKLDLWKANKLHYILISETDWLHAVILKHKVWSTGNTIMNKMITNHKEKLHKTCFSVSYFIQKSF